MPRLPELDRLQVNAFSAFDVAVRDHGISGICRRVLPGSELSSPLIQTDERLPAFAQAPTLVAVRALL